MKDRKLDDWSREHGVTPDVMERLVAARDELVTEVAREPRAWGFDLLPAGAPRRDASTELQRRSRTQGSMLAESFLAGHRPLLSLVPRPPSMPDGRRVDEVLAQDARLEPAVARALADRLRTTIQARVGRPLDGEAIDHAVRDVAWDHDLDAAHVGPRVRDALRELL